jgi:hypothetical protein
MKSTSAGDQGPGRPKVSTMRLPGTAKPMWIWLGTGDGEHELSAESQSGEETRKGFHP